MIHPSIPGLARLRRDLLRRRWARLEPRLRVELAVIALGLTAFAFWQLRVFYGDFAFTHGSRAAGLVLLATLACLLLVGGAGTALRLHQRLRGAPDGPAWLALPLPAAGTLKHQVWEAELPLRAAFLFAAAACVAAVRIAPTLFVIAGALGFPFAWVACCRAGAFVAQSIASMGARGRHATPSDHESALRALLARAWMVRSPSPRRIAAREGSWRRRSQFAALFVKDCWITRRSREARLALLPALVLSVLSVAVWNAPALRAGAFVIALLAAAAWGEWLIVLGSRDPFSVLRALPVGTRALWLSRMAWGAGATLLLVTAHTLASDHASAMLQISLVWLGISGLAIAALAINLQLTLYPQHKPALRLLGLALALALVCSMMIPLLGWAVLLGSVIHTARRLPRWWQLEEAT